MEHIIGTSLKYLQVLPSFLPQAVFANGLHSSRSFIGLHWQLLFELLPIAAEFRPVCDEQSESLLCPQTDALLSAQFQLEPCASPCVFSSENGGYPKSAKLSFFIGESYVLNDAIE